MLKEIVLLIVVALVTPRIYQSCLFAGFHTTVYNHQPGPCRYIPGIEHGAEDIDFIPGDRALFTTGLRFWDRTNANYAGVKSAVYLFDFTNPRPEAKRVEIKDFPGLDECDLHGLSVYTNTQTGDVDVYIVNHLASCSVVERFRYDDRDNSLYHKDTIGENDPNFGLLNDLVVVGPGQFYATNTLYSRNKLEMLAQLRWGFVTYFDGKQSHVVAKGLLTPNGIAQSPDGKYVYMAHMFERELITFSREKDDSLSLLEKTSLYCHPDNVVVDAASGDIWVGCHAVGRQVAAYGSDPSQPSSSKVLRIRMDAGRVGDITEILSDDGRLFSGSSVALYRKNQLFVGSIASKAMTCDVRYV